MPEQNRISIEDESLKTLAEVARDIMQTAINFVMKLINL